MQRSGLGERMCPVPVQRTGDNWSPPGRTEPLTESSMRPKRLILPIWTRRGRTEARRAGDFDLALIALVLPCPMKSMTIKPPKSQAKLASKFCRLPKVLSGRFSMSDPFVARPELTSTASGLRYDRDDGAAEGNSPGG